MSYASNGIHTCLYVCCCSADDLIEFSDSAREDVMFVKVVKDFATLGEEESVVKEMTKKFRGKKYNFDHWDKVCGCCFAFFVRT